MTQLISIDRNRGLYVLGGPDYVSCIGFDVAERKRAAIVAWLGRSDGQLVLGTNEHFEAYQGALKAGALHAEQTGKRCYAELHPKLRRMEHRWVVLRDPETSEMELIRVGRSTGWMPCHLRIEGDGDIDGIAISRDERFDVVAVPQALNGRALRTFFDRVCVSRAA